MADEEKDSAAVKIFPPALPILTILTAIGLNRVMPIDLGFEIRESVRYSIGGTIVLLAIAGLGGWSVFLIRREGQSENPWQPTSKIIDRGPFRISRNPMYLQMVIVCLGVALALMNWWLLLLTPVCGWLLQRLAIIPEEEYLTRKFGEEYLSYTRRVRRWL